jgi:deoxyribonuclease V
LIANLTHEWPNNKHQAAEIQAELAGSVEIYPINDDIQTIAAVETAYGKSAETIYASVVVCSFPEIVEIERKVQYGRIEFPYIPGMFFFREGQTIIKAFEKLETEPDLIIVHGHGIAHPLRFGMASHLGLIFNKPSIGCCRKILVGNHRDVDSLKGSHQKILYQNKEVGYAYRSKDSVKPIFISPGHLISLEQSKEYIVRNLRGYRLPEPSRFAHLTANKFKRQMEKKKTG